MSNDRMKYRVFVPETNEMITENNENSELFYCVSMDGNLFCDNYLLDGDDAIRMDCTALKDKNGVLIYEGDLILIDGHSRPQVIAWWEYATGFSCMDTRGGANYYTRIYDHSDTEIIGNIYENAELLK